MAIDLEAYARGIDADLVELRKNVEFLETGKIRLPIAVMKV